MIWLYSLQNARLYGIISMALNRFQRNLGSQMKVKWKWKIKSAKLCLYFFRYKNDQKIMLHIKYWITVNLTRRSSASGFWIRLIYAVATYISCYWFSYSNYGIHSLRKTSFCMKVKWLIVVITHRLSWPWLSTVTNIIR